MPRSSLGSVGKTSVVGERSLGTQERTVAARGCVAANSAFVIPNVPRGFSVTALRAGRGGRAR